MQHPLAQQLKAGPAIALALEQFEPVHLPFHLSV
jgi:hypothetical protein